MDIYSIYTLTNIITGKKYVGYTGNIHTRLKRHKSSVNSGVKTKLYDAIRSYGWNNFTFEVVYRSNDKMHTLKIMENYYINKFNSYNNGYNMTLGGEGALGKESWCKGKNPKQLLWTEERKKSHSQKLKTIWCVEKRNNLSEKWTDEMKKKQSYNSVSKWNEKIEKGYKVVSNNTYLVCPHCGKSNNIGNSKRWHFDNCKKRKNI